MRVETWFTWKEFSTVEGEETPRLLTPWADPRLYEFAFDFLYKTKEKAHTHKKDMGAADEEWHYELNIQVPVPAGDDEDESGAIDVALRWLDNNAGESLLNYMKAQAHENSTQRERSETTHRRGSD